jgi:hypothetical protein
LGRYLCRDGLLGDPAGSSVGPPDGVGSAGTVGLVVGVVARSGRGPGHSQATWDRRWGLDRMEIGPPGAYTQLHSTLCRERVDRYLNTLSCIFYSRSWVFEGERLLPQEILLRLHACVRAYGNLWGSMRSSEKVTTFTLTGIL